MKSAQSDFGFFERFQHSRLGAAALRFNWSSPRCASERARRPPPVAHAVDAMKRANLNCQFTVQRLLCLLVTHRWNSTIQAQCPQSLSTQCQEFKLIALVSWNQPGSQPVYTGCVSICLSLCIFPSFARRPISSREQIDRRLTCPS